MDEVECKWLQWCNSLDWSSQRCSEMPLTIPPLSSSRMHYLPLAWCTLSPLPCNPLIETSWPPDKDLFYPPCLNITQMHCQVFRHGVCLQSGWLRIIWKWERGLWCTVVCGKGSVVGQILIKTDSTVTDQDWSDCGRPKTDNGSLRTEEKLKRVWIVSPSQR